MSDKFVLAPEGQLYDPEFIEFDCRIYTGPKHGFTESVHLNANTEPRAGSVQCNNFRRLAHEWVFEFERGHICMVNDYRVRYVKGLSHSAIQRETKSDDVVAVEDGIKYGLDKLVHEPSIAPKRRGRPPKIKPE